MKIIWSRKAARDLESIREYIAHDSPTAAKKVVIAIITFVEQQLSRFPNSGKPGRVDGTLELVVPKFPYTVPYRLKHDRIEIVRIYHQNRLWPDRF